MESIPQVWLQSVLTGQLSSLRTHRLTGFAVEAAESLVGVLLVLQTRPELSEGEIFAPVAGPLSRRRLGSVAQQQEDRHGRQDLEKHKRRLVRSEEPTEKLPPRGVGRGVVGVLRGIGGGGWRFFFIGNLVRAICSLI